MLQSFEKYYPGGSVSLSMLKITPQPAPIEIQEQLEGLPEPANALGGKDDRQDLLWSTNLNALELLPKAWRNPKSWLVTVMKDVATYHDRAHLSVAGGGAASAKGRIKTMINSLHILLGTMAAVLLAVSLWVNGSAQPEVISAYCSDLDVACASAVPICNETPFDSLGRRPSSDGDGFQAVNVANHLGNPVPPCPVSFLEGREIEFPASFSEVDGEWRLVLQ